MTHWDNWQKLEVYQDYSREQYCGCAVIQTLYIGSKLVFFNNCHHGREKEALSLKKDLEQVVYDMVRLMCQNSRII
jgi:hypothetical protein